MSSVQGVIDAEAGYANGTPNHLPTAMSRRAGPGFAETVNVDYDPAVAPLPFLLESTSRPSTPCPSIGRATTWARSTAPGSTTRTRPTLLWSRLTRRAPDAVRRADRREAEARPTSPPRTTTRTISRRIPEGTATSTSRSSRRRRPQSRTPPTSRSSAAPFGHHLGERCTWTRSQRGVDVSHHTQVRLRELVDRLNRFPQGAPPSDTLYEILEMLFSEREAELVAQLPIKPFTAREGRAGSGRWTEAEARAGPRRAGEPGHPGRHRATTARPRYVLPPPMAGFFEFSMMRVRDDVDQKVLAELFYQYLNVEEDFIRELFTDGETQLGPRLRAASRC